VVWIGDNGIGGVRHNADMVASVRIGLAVLISLSVTATAFADTVRVTVDRALVWNRPSGVAVAITQLTRDTIVEVVRKIGDWYEVVLPRGAAGTETTIGYIRASQVVIETVGPPSPAAARIRTPIPPSRRPRKGLSILNIDAVYRDGRDDLTRSAAAFAGGYAEAGSITANYGNSTGVAFDLMYGQPVWGTIGLGVGAAYHLRSQSAAVDARIPHPFYFNQLRAATFGTPALKGHEAALHVPVLWMPPAFGSIKVLVYGGPSIFSVSQTVVHDLTLREAYPYDTVAIAGAITEDRTGTVFGFHAGADVSYFFHRSIGVGGGARYSRATITFSNDAGSTTDGVAGGIEAVGGLRFRF
jgi:hypothetical protein